MVRKPAPTRRQTRFGTDGSRIGAAGALHAALRRIALVPPTLLGITLVTFALVHLAPGDPASLRAGEVDFEGEDSCHGSTGGASCNRTLHYRAQAEYKPS